MLDSLPGWLARFAWAWLVTRLAVLVMSFTLHGFVQAGIASLLGDPTPREAGRLTLDPRWHVESLGVLLGLGIGLGWGRPVSLRPDRMRVPAPLGGALVALAGPLTYAALTGIGAAGLRLLHVPPSLAGATWPTPAQALTLLARINLGLALFHLLPLFPLDGYFVIHHLLPLRAMARWEALAGRTTLILGVGVALLLLTPLPVWEAWIVPPVQRVTAALLGW